MLFLQNLTLYLAQVVSFSAWFTFLCGSEEATVAQKLFKEKENAFQPPKHDHPLLHRGSSLVDLVTATSRFIFQKLNI